VIGNAHPTTVPADHWKALRASIDMLIDGCAEDIARLVVVLSDE
jgi:hypothetical protein